MRVCLVSREVAPFWGAGIGTYVAQMAAAWAGAGHETHVVTGAHPGLGSGLVRDGVWYHTLDVEGAGLDRARFEFQRHGAAVRALLCELHRERPMDYIEFPDYWAEGHAAIAAARTRGELQGAVLGVRLHTPTHEARAFNAELEKNEEIELLEQAEDYAIGEADAVISPTRALLDVVSDRTGRCGRTRAVVAYPFDMASMAELGSGLNDGSEQPARGDTTPIVLYVGRLERRKGVEILVVAAQRVLAAATSARFVFVGADTRTGPGGSSMLEHLKSMIAPEWGGSFTFEGALPRSELAGVIRSAAASGGACCFPSLWENFPNVCVEAMALGAPVIGSDAGGMAEIIEEGTSGVLFRSGDDERLAAAIGRVLRDRALRERITEGAPARIRALCDPKGVVGNMIEAIEVVRRAMPAAARGVGVQGAVR